MSSTFTSLQHHDQVGLYSLRNNNANKYSTKHRTKSSLAQLHADQTLWNTIQQQRPPAIPPPLPPKARARVATIPPIPEVSPLEPSATLPEPKSQKDIELPLASQLQSPPQSPATPTSVDLEFLTSSPSPRPQRLPAIAIDFDPTSFDFTPNYKQNNALPLKSQAPTSWGLEIARQLDQISDQNGLLTPANSRFSKMLLSLDFAEAANDAEGKFNNITISTAQNNATTPQPSKAAPPTSPLLKSHMRNNSASSTGSSTSVASSMRSEDDDDDDDDCDDNSSIDDSFVFLDPLTFHSMVTPPPKLTLTRSSPPPVPPKRRSPPPPPFASASNAYKSSTSTQHQNDSTSHLRTASVDSYDEEPHIIISSEASSFYFSDSPPISPLATARSKHSSTASAIAPSTQPPHDTLPNALPRSSQNNNLMEILASGANQSSASLVSTAASVATTATSASTITVCKTLTGPTQTPAPRPAPPIPQNDAALAPEKPQQSQQLKSMLSLKRDTAATPAKRKVSKAAISAPTGLVDADAHFSPVEMDTPQKPPPRTSVISSLPGVFKSLKKDSSSSSINSQLQPQQPQQTQQPPSAQPSRFSLQHANASTTSMNTVDTSRSKKNLRKSFLQGSAAFFRSNGTTDSEASIPTSTSSGSISSSRRSFLGTFPFPSSSSNSSLSSVAGNSSSTAHATTSSSSSSTDLHKSMISLPVPVDASREKLKNKLKASSSLLSITRSETDGAIIAVPVDVHNSTQMGKLLAMTSSNRVENFETFVKSVPSPLSKLNEAAFSEVFIDQESTRVYKIIPFGNDELSQSPIHDLLQELKIARLLTRLQGFAQVLDIAVVKGIYPETLLSEWDKFLRIRGSENLRPDMYTDDQLYCVIVQNNAGTDLERVQIGSWQDAESVFWQTAAALASAEEWHQFEHRDLHWGNIVISRHDNANQSSSPSSVLKCPPGANAETSARIGLIRQVQRALFDGNAPGLAPRVTLIDYTLSRAAAAAATTASSNTGVLYTPMDQPEFFRGKGDYQYDVYRRMRDRLSDLGAEESHSSASSVSGGNLKNINWATFCPQTNVFWLHYLADKLFNHKGLRPLSMTARGRIVRAAPGASEVAASATAASSSAAGAPGRPSSAVASAWMAEEARACKALEQVYRALAPGATSFGDASGNSDHHNELGSATGVLQWGLRTKIFPMKNAF